MENGLLLLLLFLWQSKPLFLSWAESWSSWICQQEQASYTVSCFASGHSGWRGQERPLLAFPYSHQLDGGRVSNKELVRYWLFDSLIVYVVSLPPLPILLFALTGTGYADIFLKKKCKKVVDLRFEQMSSVGFRPNPLRIFKKERKYDS